MTPVEMAWLAGFATVAAVALWLVLRRFSRPSPVPVPREPQTDAQFLAGLAPSKIPEDPHERWKWAMRANATLKRRVEIQTTAIQRLEERLRATSQLHAIAVEAKADVETMHAVLIEDQRRLQQRYDALQGEYGRCAEERDQLKRMIEHMSEMAERPSRSEPP